jgi:uncharacterized protein (TIGR02246 family)
MSLFPGDYTMNQQSARELLLRRDAEWSAAASEGSDVERILSFWTEDAVVIAPGLPTIAGKVALRQYVVESFRIPGFRISWDSSDVTFSPDGNMAYMFGSNSVTMTGPDGVTNTSEGRAVTIWRKEQDGQWRCAVDIWNS